MWLLDVTWFYANDIHPQTIWLSSEIVPEISSSELKHSSIHGWSREGQMGKDLQSDSCVPER